MKGASGSDGMTNLAFALLATVAGLGLLLRVAGSITAHLTGTTPSSRGLAGGLRVLLTPADPARALGAPGLPTVWFWTVATALLAVTATVAWCGWYVLCQSHGKSTRDPRRLAGTATARDVAKAGSRKVLLGRSSQLRPSLARPRPQDVGYLLGTCRGKDVWASVEDSVLVLGPPRSGKGLHLVINAILDAPGAVITTSTRPDNLTATMGARSRHGPVAVFDPQHLAEGLPSGLRWSPLRGCENPLTAMIRANGFASATGLSTGGVESGGFWEGKTRTALQALLHAAALGHCTPGDLFAWSLSPAAAADAVAILSAHPDAAPRWAESLETTIHSDPRTRDSIWMGVSLALTCLADPRVMDAVTPRPGEEFDPASFLRADGTLYLLATGAGASSSWSLVAAFIEDLVETARALAASSPGARLDPPLLLALDEIGNLSPLPSLPTLMAEGGGTGITTMPVLQSLSQARAKWGDHNAGAIWDASIIKIVLGGASVARDLQDVSALIGDREENTDTVSSGDHGARSVQRSTRRVPVMPPETNRTLPFGTALLLLRSAAPLITDLRSWTSRPDAGELQADRARLERELRRN